MTAEPHIVIVDDDDEICQLARQFLEPHGFRITAVADGTSMRTALVADPADLIVLDLMLSGEDGLALCRQIRATSRTPIIFLTAVNSEADRVVRLEMGADDYLPKPFSARELLARIRAVLRRATPVEGEVALPAQAVASSRILRFSGWSLDTGAASLRHRMASWSTSAGASTSYCWLFSSIRRSCSRGTSCWISLAAVSAVRSTVQSICRSAGCAARLKRIRRTRPSSRPCAAVATCWRRE